MTIEELESQLAELDAAMASLHDKKVQLARQYNEQLIAQRTAERVARMSDTEKDQMIQALGVKSGAKVNGG